MGYTTGGSAQQMSNNNTMEVTTFFACQHSVTSFVACTTTTAPIQMADGPCNNPKCQAAPPTVFPTITCYSADKGKFVNKIKTELELAGMAGEKSLRLFNLAEPQTEADLVEAGYSPQLIQALSKCGAFDRSSSSANFLGHRNVLAVLKQLEICVENHGPQWQAAILSSQLSQLNAGVQQRLSEISTAVKHLTVNAYSAPGLTFPMEEGIKSHQKSLGQSELAALHSTPEGLAILSQPLTNANILAAKTSIRNARSSPQDTTAGAEQPVVTASTLLPSSNSSSGTTINLHATVNGDISCLRPERRVMSAKMAQTRTSLAIDLSKADAYVNKSYTQLDNPWWAAKEA